MESAVWQALPPRRHGRRSETKGDDDFSLKKQKEIHANVQARAEKSAAGSWAAATLEGKDGCAGEFYEYLDHTADVQCHSWGPTLEKALEAMAPCMFNYMTDLTLIEEDPAASVEFTVRGHDLKSLLFNYMDELLFRFCTDGLCVKRVQVLQDIDLRNVAHNDAGVEVEIEDASGGGAEAGAEAGAKPSVDSADFSPTKRSKTVKQQSDHAEAGEGGGASLPQSSGAAAGAAAGAGGGGAGEAKHGSIDMRVKAHGCTYDRNKHVQGTEVKAITYSNMQIHIRKARAQSEAQAQAQEARCDLYVIVDI